MYPSRLKTTNQIIPTSLNILLCPKCNSSLLGKWGREAGRQRVMCRKCKQRTTLSVEDTQDLDSGNLINLRKELLPILFKQPEELTNEELYCLGWLIADGCLNKLYGCLTLEVQSKDKEILTLVANILKIDNKIIYQRRERNEPGAYSKVLETHKLVWSSKYSVALFEKFGIIPNKTGNEVWLPYMENNHFIRGFLDGDGCVRYDEKKRGGYIRFTGSSLNYLQSLADHLYNLLGITGTFQNQEHVGKKTVMLNYSTNKAKILGRFLHENSDNLRLERKYINFQFLNQPRK